MRIQHIIHMCSLFRSMSYSIQLRSFIKHSYEVSWYYIWTLTKELKDLKVYSSSEATSYDMRIQHIIHMYSLFRSISYSIQLRSFIKHSYEVPWYPIWTLTKELNDLKVDIMCIVGSSLHITVRSIWAKANVHRYIYFNVTESEQYDVDIRCWSAW